MWSLFRPAAFAVALVSLAPIAAACFALDSHGENGDCDGEIVTIGVGDATPMATIYYVVVGDTPDNAYGYIEVNGETGLQRGGCPPFWARWAYDPCQQSDNPDIMWY